MQMYFFQVMPNVISRVHVTFFCGHFLLLVVFFKGHEELIQVLGNEFFDILAVSINLLSNE